MDVDASPSLTDAWLRERPRLLGLAYRMLGSAAEAEEIVQDAWIKASSAAEVRDAGPFLRTVVARLCLDRLRSARARRETYVGPWLPEPIVAVDDPDPDSLAVAFLEVAERLAPEERLAVVLHDALDVPVRDVAEILEKQEPAVRKLLQRARERLGGPVRRRAAPGEAEAMLAAFGAAVQTGDVDELVALLAPDAVWLTDGGGRTNAAIRPVAGARNVARMVLGLVRKGGDAITVPAWINGQLALLSTRAGQVYSVAWLEGGPGGITVIRSVINPDKLAFVARELKMPVAEPWSWRKPRAAFAERCAAAIGTALADPRVAALADRVLATGPDVLRVETWDLPADVPEAAWMPVLAAAFAGGDLTTAIRAAGGDFAANERGHALRATLERPGVGAKVTDDRIARLAARGEPILAVADLHGHVGHLDALLAWAEGVGELRTVCVGDYCDNGPDMLGLVERLIGRPDIVAIAGNHDVMPVLAAGRPGEAPDPDSFDVWQGWGRTLAMDLGARDAASFAKKLPAHVRTWLADRPWVHETDRYCFVHAGMHPGSLRPQVDALREKRLPTDGFRLPAQVAMKQLAQVADPAWDRVVISGHTNHKGPHAFVGPNRICLSGEVDRSGTLYAVVLPARRFVAVGPDLVVRDVR